MRRRLPRTWLGRIRFAVVATEAVLLLLLLGSTGALGTIRERWDAMSRTPESRGASLYQASCASCHGGATGGQVTDFPPKHNANGHTWQHADCELLVVVRDGTTAGIPTTHAPASAVPLASPMPAFVGRLEDDDIRDVIAFIRTMWTDDQRAAQRRATAERCRT